MVVKNFARQGDLLFIRQKSIPNDAKKAEDHILAYGEVTGHKHAAVGIMECYDVGEGNKVVESDKNWHVTHDEHDTVFLEKGIWEIRRQREYAPEEIRQVVD